MRPYYIKYGFIFLTIVLLMNLITFLISENKQRDGLASLLVLKQALEQPLEKSNLDKINEILDLYPDKIILEKSGIVLSSNYGKNQADRLKFGEEQLRGQKEIWQPLMVSSKSNSQIIYHRSNRADLWNRLLTNTIITFGLSLCLLPLLIFSLKDVAALVESVEYLHYYLDSTRLKLQKLKNRYPEAEKEEAAVGVINTSESENRKITDLKNEKRVLKQDIERKKNEITNLKNVITELKTDAQAIKSEKNSLEEEKKKVIKEKEELQQRLLNQENILKAKTDEIGRNLKKLKEVEDLVAEIKEHSKIQEAELQKLKASRVDTGKFNELKAKNTQLQSEVFQKQDDIKGLLTQINLKNARIDELKQSNEEIRLDKLKYENQVNNLEIKITTDKEIIEALVNENNQQKDEIMSLQDKLKELNVMLDNINRHGEDYLTEELYSLKNLLKEKDNRLNELLDEIHQKDNSVKELTLDTLDKLSALKRYEAQINELTMDIMTKNTMLESLTTRINMKEKIINSLNEELEETREKLKENNTGLNLNGINEQILIEPTVTSAETLNNIG